MNSKDRTNKEPTTNTHHSGDGSDHRVDSESTDDEDYENPGNKEKLPIDGDVEDDFDFDNSNQNTISTSTDNKIASTTTDDEDSQFIFYFFMFKFLTFSNLRTFLVGFCWN